MFANFATAIPTGAAITFMLLFAMQSLIALQPGFAADTRAIEEIKFLRVIPQEELIREQFPIIDLPERVEPPLVEQTDYQTSDGTGFTIPHNPVVPNDNHGHNIDPITSNGPLMAIVRVQPHYPATAQSRGLEGFVVVQFDVLSSGAVANISVLKSSSSVFERSAKQAAARFRFKARVVDGVPQTSTGVQYQFTFKMDD